MSDNPVEAAVNELKKWLEQLKKIMDLLKALEKERLAEQKAIGDKALAAHKEMVAKTKHDELLKEFKNIKESIKNAPDGTPGKAEALEQAKELEQKMDDPDAHSLDPDQSIEGEGLDAEGEGIDAADGKGVDMEEEVAESIEGVAKTETVRDSLKNEGYEFGKGTGNAISISNGPSIG